jgi:hypothetical protein
MTFKGACLAIALIFGTAGSSSAVPLVHPEGLSSAGSLTQEVRRRRHPQRRRHTHRRRGYWRGCPYRYEQNLLGQWRLISPCSNRMIIHAF